MTLYDFTAEHWIHLRTTNPITTVRLRTAKTRDMLTEDTMLTMVFRLSLSAQKRWRLLNRSVTARWIASGIEFIDGIKEEEAA
ncbi:MAG TPA: hypothetical protein V6C97_36070 [Oculatellaceae cyanobacterium]